LALAFVLCDLEIKPALCSTDLPVHGCYGRQCWLLSKRRQWWKWGGNWWRQPAKRTCQSKWVWVRPQSTFKADTHTHYMGHLRTLSQIYLFPLDILKILTTLQDSHFHIDSGNPKGFRNPEFV